MPFESGKKIANQGRRIGSTNKNRGRDWAEKIMSEFGQSQLKEQADAQTSRLTLSERVDLLKWMFEHAFGKPPSNDPKPTVLAPSLYFEALRSRPIDVTPKPKELEQ